MNADLAGFIGLAALIVTSVAWLRADTHRCMDRLESRLNERMDRFGERMDRFGERMDRFEERMHRFEVRMDRLEAGQDGLRERMARLEGMVDVLREAVGAAVHRDAA